MPERDLSKIIADMREYIRRQVIAGFDPPSSISESAPEVFVDDADEEILRPIAERLTREIVADHVCEQAGWPDVTDCDRLDDAFAELNRNGIVSRQNFSCCGNCGVVEIGGEIRAERDAGLSVRGYAFYHMQDTESASDGYGLYLYYGSMEDGDSATLQVGKAIVEALERHGLATRWNGRSDTRIHVQLDWKRRRPIEVDADRPLL
jgi:hypothetical protein